jgi:Flp pilus assembly protein TadG
MKRSEDGAVILEFTLVLLLFLMFLFGIMDFSRLLYTWQMANETTREGARYAVACAEPTNSDRVKARMKALMPQIDPSNIDVVWSPGGCDSTNCEGVTVSLTNMQFNWISPIVGTSAAPLFPMPNFSTYLQREMMSYNPLIC